MNTATPAAPNPLPPRARGTNLLRQMPELFGLDSLSGIETTEGSWEEWDLAVIRADLEQLRQQLAVRRVLATAPA